MASNPMSSANPIFIFNEITIKAPTPMGRPRINGPFLPQQPKRRVGRPKTLPENFNYFTEYYLKNKEKFQERHRKSNEKLKENTKVKKSSKEMEQLLKRLTELKEILNIGNILV